jgi:hypothetical protein
VGGGCVGAWEGGRGKQEVCALGSARGGVSRAKSDSIIDFDAEEKEVEWAGGGRRKAKQSKARVSPHGARAVKSRTCFFALLFVVQMRASKSKRFFQRA